MSLLTDIANDLDSVFFNTNDFAVSATLTIGVTDSTIKIILDQPFRGVDPTTGLEFTTHELEAVCKYSDVSGAGQGDTLTVSGTTYYIMGEAQKELSGDTCRIPLSKEALHG